MKTILSKNGYLLREWRVEDAAEYVRLIQDKSNIKYLRPGTPTTKEGFLHLVNSSGPKRGFYNFAIEMDGQIVGGNAYAEEGSSRIELRGLWIAPQYRGNKLGEKVTETLLDFVSKAYPDRIIYSQIISTNQRMINSVVEIGFVLNPEKMKIIRDSEGKFVKLLYFEVRPAGSIWVV